MTALLAAAGWPDVAGPVLVAGRQPALGCVAAFLLSGVARPSSVGKGAVWWLLRRRDGDGRTELLTVHGT